MGFKGAIINRLQGGLGRTNPTEDGVCLLIVENAIAADNLALKEAKELLSVENAVALGIDASYDDTNSILAYHHIDEFFRISPNGNLFVVLDDGTLTADDIKTILNENDTISMLGFVRNSNLPVNDLPVYMAAKQDIITSLRAENRYVSSVLIEGNVFNPDTLISDYEDLRAVGAENVSVILAQDPLIAGIKAAYANYAAIGATLGALSVRGVHENLGSVDIESKPQAYKGQLDYALTDVARQRWLSANLNSGKPFASLVQNEILELAAKGYIIAGAYNGYAGIFFSDSHTATLPSSDYGRIENNRTWDKAANLVRAVLLPRVKSNVATDPSTGTIATTAASEMEVLAKKALDQMIAAGEISGAEVYIDPQQSLLNDQPLHIKVRIVKNGIVHEIIIDLGLTAKLS